jgi:hypothetical protein
VDRENQLPRARMMTAVAKLDSTAQRQGNHTAARTVIAMITAFTVIRVLSAAFVGLGVDESYTLSIARQLQLSYFDHPPLHLWIVHAFSGVLGYGRLARLPFIALFAGSSWLLFILTARLFGPRAGVWAVLTLNISAFFTVAAGAWVLPDGPLLFCLLSTAVQIERLAFGGDRLCGDVGWRWFAVGVWLGLAALSKYQAVLFAIGLGGFMLTTPQGRAWLRRPAPYLAAVVTAALLTPVIVWNAQNEWASLAFQGGRAGPSHGLRLGAPFAALAGQAGLLLPWIFVPATFATWRALREGPSDQHRWLCVMLGVPGVLLFALTPLWGQASLPHWGMPSWLFLIPLLADQLARADVDHTWPRTWAVCAIAAYFALWAVLLDDAATGWVGRAWPGLFPKGDPTLESVEWEGLTADRALQGLNDPFVVAMKWNEAGRARAQVPERTPVVVFSDDPRGFGDIRSASPLVGRDALILVKPKDLGAGFARVRRCFDDVTPLRVVDFGRRGTPEIELHLYVGRRLRPSCSELGRRSETARRQWLALKAHDDP